VGSLPSTAETRSSTVLPPRFPAPGTEGLL
jgi:hypothetical protein